MILFPAMDLHNKKVVRLKQGNFSDETIYPIDPLKIVTSFVNDGATQLHIVDLNATKGDLTQNIEIIRSLAKHISIPMQIGGGIRTYDRALELIQLGVSKIIIGTKALDPVFLKQMVEAFGDKLIVSIDDINGKIATHGWMDVTSIDALSFCISLEQQGVKTIVYTDISKDGMLEGPQFEFYETLVKQTNLNIIASGGVSSLDDLLRLKEIGVYGVIVGKALYEKKFSLKEAILCLQKESSLVSM